MVCEERGWADHAERHRLRPRRLPYPFAVSLTPFGDTFIVLRNGGTKAAAFGIHFATAMVVVISAALLFAT
ncbi:DUF4267 domain-containing protein [Actinocorallia lasiicapitis]